MKGIEQAIKQPGKAEETTKAVEEFVQKKEQSKPSKTSPQKAEPLPKISEEYQQLCNIQYVQDSEARKDLFWIIDKLKEIPDLKLEKTADHDLSGKFKGRTLVKICPLKKGWSASIGGQKIQQYTKEQVVSSIRVQQGVEDHPKPQNQDDKKVIEKLEERIGKMDKTSKGISLKGTKVTSEVNKWVKIKGYTIDGTTLLVQ